MNERLSTIKAAKLGAVLGGLYGLFQIVTRRKVGFCRVRPSCARGGRLDWLGTIGSCDARLERSSYQFHIAREVMRQTEACRSGKASGYRRITARRQTGWPWLTSKSSTPRKVRFNAPRGTSVKPRRS